MNRTDKELLLSDIDAGLILLDTRRPSAGAVNRAETIFKRVKVACQNIPITPLDESDPDEPPIIDPDEPDPDPGTDPGEPEPTTITTVYTSLGDFSTSQGFKGWSYLEEDGTAMTFDTTTNLWRGRETFQGIWSTGQHPGAVRGSMRRWTAPSAGTYVITGSVSDAAAGGTGIRFKVLKNGVQIHSVDVPDGGSAPALNLVGSAAFNDTFDFLVADTAGDVSFDSTNVSVSIALTTQGTGGSPTQTALPFLLNGTAPQEAIYSINMNKPANADSCTLSITGVNLDAAYGLLYFNGTSNSLAIWATDGTKTGVSGTVQLSVPVVYVFNGQNTLRFTHTTGSGFTITAVSVQFTTPVTPEPPVTQTSLPFILNGSILPEDGLLTMTLSKPANVTSTCTVSVTGTDLAEADGTMSVNGTTNSMTIWPVNAANNGAVRTVQLTVNSSWFNNGTNTLRFTHTTGDGFIVSAVSVQFTQVIDPIPGTGDWPAQPSNQTTLTDFALSVIPPTNPFNGWRAIGNMSIVSDSTAPLSPPNVARYNYNGLAANGTSPGNIYFEPSNTQGWRSCYFAYWWKYSSDFKQHVANLTKMSFLILGNDFRGDQIVLLRGNPPNHLVLLLEMQGTTNDHIGGNPGDPSIVLFANQGSASTAPNTWYRIEQIFTRSTSPTSRDGSTELRINGVRTHLYTNINTSDRNVVKWELNPTWGGNSTGGETGQGFFYYDHVHIAVLP